MEKVIGSFQFDGDQMSVYNLIEDINEVLGNYGFTLETDDEEHDGFDVATLKVKENQVFTRAQLIKAVDSFGFHLSDNGDPDTDVEEWVNDMYPLEEEEDD